MRKLWVVLPNRASCERLVNELELFGIPERQMHVLASLGQDLRGLPEADVWQKTELARGVEWGIGLGGVAGLLGALLALRFPPAGLSLGLGSVILATLGGGGVGALVNALLGVHRHSHWLDDFRKEIAAGRLLLLIDLSGGQVAPVRERILELDPQVRLGVLKPTIRSG